VINPFLNRTAKKAKQSTAFWRSKRQEKELGKRLGATQIVGSGNKLRKGDLSINGIARIEAKTTSSSSFRVTLDMIEILKNASLPSDQIPAIIIEFLNERGKPKAEIAIIPVDLLEALISHAAKSITAANSR